MNEFSPTPQRGLRRLRGFDYTTARAYFLTICVCQRHAVLSEIKDLSVHLLPAGHIVERHWNDLPKRYPVVLDAFVIMPDHVHGILFIDDLKSGPTARPKAGVSLSDIVRGFKTFTAMDINRMLGATGKPFWQRNYYDHIIRNEEEMQKVREYIRDNPVSWELKQGAEPELPY